MTHEACKEVHGNLQERIESMEATADELYAEIETLTNRCETYREEREAARDACERAVEAQRQLTARVTELEVALRRLLAQATGYPNRQLDADIELARRALHAERDALAERVKEMQDEREREADEYPSAVESLKTYKKLQSETFERAETLNRMWQDEKLRACAAEQRATRAEAALQEMRALLCSECASVDRTRALSTGPSEGGGDEK